LKLSLDMVTTYPSTPFFPVGSSAGLHP
jgi:hypothetical protein